jgi:hypothetical protein
MQREHEYECEYCHLDVVDPGELEADDDAAWAAQTAGPNAHGPDCEWILTRGHTRRARYRAAYLGQTVLTGPQHSLLSDEDLMAEALRELDRTDPGHAVDADGEPLAPRDAVEIGDWTDLQCKGAKD